jgi:hypothetical protein
MLQNCTVIANLFSIKFWSGIIRPVVAAINPFLVALFSVLGFQLTGAIWSAQCGA